MRSTFWPIRSLERQSCQNRYTCLKFSSKRKNSALSMKIVQNALFRSCAARFGQIAFLSIKVLKIVTLASNSFQNGKTARFPWKLYKTSRSKRENSFQVMRSTFWPTRILERQSCQNSYTCLKFSSKRENSALSMKIVRNALFSSSAARFGQIAFLSIKVLKIVTLAWNSLKNGKTVRFAWKLYKTLFSGHAPRVLAKSHFGASKLSKYVTLVLNSLQNGKTVRFPWKLYETPFSAHPQHVLAKSHFWASKFLKSSHWPEILLKTGKQFALHENCTKRSFQVMRRTF